jgi:hypothetical protein
VGGTGGYCEALVFFSHLLYLRVCLRVRHGGFWLGEETEGLELGFGMDDGIEMEDGIVGIGMDDGIC